MWNFVSKQAKGKAWRLCATPSVDSLNTFPHINDHLSCYLVSPVTGVNSSSQSLALSTTGFNKTALFMLIGFSNGNGFSQWVTLFFLQVSHFFSGLLGSSPGQILYHWLWFPEVSDPSLQAQWTLPEIWPYFGSPCLILYTLMQSEVARLNSLSISLPPFSTGFQKSPAGTHFSMLRNVNDTAILRSIKRLDDISVALMKTGIRSSRRPTASRWASVDCCCFFASEWQGELKTWLLPSLDIYNKTTCGRLSLGQPRLYNISLLHNMLKCR